MLLASLVFPSSLFISAQGATGKCTSLSKFYDSIMNKKSADSLAITNDFQSKLAHLTEDSLRNADDRKRRVSYEPDESALHMEESTNDTARKVH